MATRTELKRMLEMMTHGAKACEVVEKQEVIVPPPSTGLMRQEPIHCTGMPVEGVGKRAVPKSLQKHAEKVHKKYNRLKRTRGSQGFGIGKKIEGGETTDETVLRVYVEKKLSRRECSNRDIMVPKFIEQKGVAKIPTDVVAIGRIKLETSTFGAFRHKARPARGGASIFHLGEKEAGTLGCLVLEKGKRRPIYILSNAHVLSNDSTAFLDDPIIQPGGLDGGGAGDIIATLFKSVEFQFKDTPNARPNTVDAAIAKVTRKSLVDAVIEEIGLPVGVSTNLRAGMHVKKAGRTSGLTTGLIQDINFSTKPIKYRKPDGRTESIEFHNQVMCTKYSQGGDSGAAVLNNKNEVVGLHFAGSEAASIFNKINLVMDTFNIELYTG